MGVWKLLILCNNTFLIIFNLQGLCDLHAHSGAALPALPIHHHVVLLWFHPQTLQEDPSPQGKSKTSSHHISDNSWTLLYKNECTIVSKTSCQYRPEESYQLIKPHFLRLEELMSLVRFFFKMLHNFWQTFYIITKAIVFLKVRFMLYFFHYPLLQFNTSLPLRVMLMCWGPYVLMCIYACFENVKTVSPKLRMVSTDLVQIHLRLSPISALAPTTFRCRVILVQIQE